MSSHPTMRLLALVGFVGFQFTVVDFANFSVTLGLVILPILVVQVIRPQVRSTAIAFSLMTIAWSCITLLAAPSSSYIEFLRTFGMLLVTLVLIVLAWGSETRKSRLLSVARGLRDGLLLVCALVIIQYLESTSGRFTSYQVFDRLVTARHYQAQSDPTGYLSRPMATYVEPSFLVAICALAALVAILLLRNSALTLGAYGVIVILTGSTTGYLLWMLTALVAITNWRLTQAEMKTDLDIVRFQRNSISKSLVPVMALFTAGLLAILIQGGAIPVTHVARFQEIFMDGSSGYARSTYVVRGVIDGLSAFPMGAPLGNSHLVTADMVFGAGVTGVGLHNGLGLFALHFSLWAVVALLVGWYGASGLIRWNSQEKKPSLFLTLAVIGAMTVAYSARGTPFNPDYIALFLLVVLSLRLRLRVETPIRNSPSHVTMR